MSVFYDFQNLHSMLACLLTCLRAESNGDLKLEWKDSQYAAFDIKISDKSTTHNGDGWFVVFRVYNGDEPGELKYVSGKNQSETTANGITVKILEGIEDQTNNKVIGFQVTNNGGDTIKYDLGVFADVQIDGNDNATITAALEGKMLSIKNEYTGVAYTLLLGREIDEVSSVDRVFYGEMDKSNTPANYPYFNNTKISEVFISYKDSCFAFSWTNRTVDKGDTTTHKIFAAVGTSINTPPTIGIGMEESIFEVGQLDGIEIFIIDLQSNDEISYYYEDSNGVTKSKTIGKLFSKKGLSYYYDIIPYDSAKPQKFWLAARATDSSGLQSNLDNRTFIITIKPNLTITSTINESYRKGETINISGTTYDDTTVYIKYVFDNGTFTKEFSQKIECNGTTKAFEYSIDISEFKYPGNYSLKIYAEDEFGFKSDAKFDTYKMINIYSRKPELDSISLKSKSLQPGEKISIYGKVRDYDKGETVQISADIKGFNHFELGKKISNGDWMDFSGTIDIPSKPENYSLIIQAKDEFGEYNVSEAIQFSVYIPEKTPSSTPEPQKIVIQSPNVIPENQKDNNLVIYIVVPLCLVAVIIITVALYFKFRREEPSEEETAVEMEETVIGNEDNAVTLDNPLFTTSINMNDDDPFADDFEEGNTTKYFFAYNNEEKQ